MLLREPGPVEDVPLAAVELPDPHPGPGQVRIRVRACGVCHTDLHTVEGELRLPKLPLIPGHQIVGVVDEVGEGVSGLVQGQRVGVGWLGWACGECAFCRSGRENLCERAEFTGLHRDGGYAEYAVADARFVYRLPDGFSDIQAAPLLCAGIIGYRALRLSGVQPGQHLGLYGFGASAHIVLQIARHWGCRVYVFTRGEAHRALARELGAVWAGDARDDAGAPMHASIIFAPAGELVPLALGALDKGGTLALAGITMSDIPQMPYELLYHERTVRSVANSTREDAQGLLEVAAQMPVHTEVETYPLAEANRVLQRLKARQVQGAAVLTVGLPDSDK
ncbi:MAG: zinc-dependent alcohol dehydrogenase family protein [Anaerolineales bacterium]